MAKVHEVIGMWRLVQRLDDRGRSLPLPPDTGIRILWISDNGTYMNNGKQYTWHISDGKVILQTAVPGVVLTVTETKEHLITLQRSDTKHYGVYERSF